MYVRNQRLNASQVTQQLQPGGSGLQSNAHACDLMVVRGTLWSGHVAGRHVEFRDALPKTPIAKILRRKLR